MTAQRTKTLDVPKSPLRVRPRVYRHEIDSNFHYKIAIDPDAAMGLHGQPLDPVAKHFAETSNPPLPLTELMREFVKSGDVVLDLGAHIGTFAVPAAAIGCRVYAIEASRRNAALLRESAAQNGWRDRLTVVEIAISNRTGELTFTPNGPFGCVANAKSGYVGGISVPCARIDDILARESCNRVHFIKLDIEGWEVAALEGAERLLRHDNAPPILYESNYIGLDFYDQTPRDLRAAFVKFGYKYHYIVRPGRLIAVAPDDFQANVVSDYLATTTPLADLGDWTVENGPSQSELIEGILESQRDPDPRCRVHIGRALRAAPITLLANAQVHRFVLTLRNDPDARVRDAVEWSKRGVFGRFIYKARRVLANRGFASWA